MRLPEQDPRCLVRVPIGAAGLRCQLPAGHGAVHVHDPARGQLAHVAWIMRIDQEALERPETAGKGWSGPGVHPDADPDATAPPAHARPPWSRYRSRLP